MSRRELTFRNWRTAKLQHEWGSRIGSRVRPAWEWVHGKGWPPRRWYLSDTPAEQAGKYWHDEVAGDPGAGDLPRSWRKALILYAGKESLRAACEERDGDFRPAAAYMLGRAVMMTELTDADFAVSDADEVTLAMRVGQEQPHVALGGADLRTRKFVALPLGMFADVIQEDRPLTVDDILARHGDAVLL